MLKRVIAIFERIAAIIGLLGVIILYALGFYLLQKSTLFAGFHPFSHINLGAILGQISVFVLIILAIRGFAGIFSSLKPIPKALYEHWPKPVKILVAIIIIVLVFVILGLAGEYTRSLA